MATLKRGQWHGFNPGVKDNLPLKYDQLSLGSAPHLSCTQVGSGALSAGGWGVVTNTVCVRVSFAQKNQLDRPSGLPSLKVHEEGVGMQSKEKHKIV